MTIKHMNEEWIKCPFVRQVNAVYERNGTFALKFYMVNLSMYHPRWPVMDCFNLPGGGEFDPHAKGVGNLIHILDVM